MSILIEYLAEERLARISASEGCSPRDWQAVRRVCEENCDETVPLGDSAVSMPWWRLVGMRQALVSVLQYRGLSAAFSDSARAFLLHAARRHATYAATAQPWTEGQVLEGLQRVGFARALLPYQARNVASLVALPAAATFSVPGAGKTTEALAVYALARESADRLLVVAPKNAFMAWEEELPACLPQSPAAIVRLTGGAQRIRETLAEGPPATIITYQQLAFAYDAVVGFVARHPVHLVIDESHRMKRGTSGVHGNCILGMAHLAKRKLIMSGTPMPNAVTDLVPQFQFLYPEVPVTDEDVVSRVRTVYVRTTKSELGLAEPARVKIAVPMSPAQERLYSALTSEAGRRAEGLRVWDRLRFRTFARSVLHLLQAASNPALLATSDLADHPLLAAALEDGLSPKLTEACRIARQHAETGRKTVIWSAFVQTVEHVAGLLADLGAEFIHGGVGTSEDDGAVDSREAKVRHFNAAQSGCMVLVANPAACAEGISLHHTCHHALYIDRTFNAAHYLQSEDRIHRIGLPPGVNTYITLLATPGSVDEVVEHRLNAKVARMGQVLDDPNLNIQALDVDALDEAEFPGGMDMDDFAEVRAMLLGPQRC